MPICPGCEQKMSYDELDAHERVCNRIWTEVGNEAQSFRHLEGRLAALEREIKNYLNDRDGSLANRIETTSTSPRSERSNTPQRSQERRLHE